MQRISVFTDFVYCFLQLDRAEYSVEFKTTSSKGVIFYVANKEHVDFVGIYINKGLVSAAFNCGGGVARATLTNAYNDGQWHTVSESNSLFNLFSKSL